MKFSTTYLSRVADKMLNKDSQLKAFKELGQRRDWKSIIIKCHEKITEEYKFWLAKKSSDLRDNKLKDLNKDISFIKLLESKTAIADQESKKLKEVSKKYGIS